MGLLDAAALSGEPPAKKAKPLPPETEEYTHRGPGKFNGKTMAVLKGKDAASKAR